MTASEQEEPVVTICFCGRTHAPWWGRYVPAPSCDLLPADKALSEFLAWSRMVPNAA